MTSFYRQLNLLSKFLEGEISKTISKHPANQRWNYLLLLKYLLSLPGTEILLVPGMETFQSPSWALIIEILVSVKTYT